MELSKETKREWFILNTIAKSILTLAGFGLAFFVTLGVSLFVKNCTDYYWGIVWFIMGLVFSMGLWFMYKFVTNY